MNLTLGVSRDEVRSLGLKEDGAELICFPI